MIEKLTNYCRFEIDEHRPGNVFSGSSLAEEGVKTVITSSDGFVRWHLTVRLDAMFETVKFPAGITNLDSGLTNVDWDTLTLKEKYLLLTATYNYFENSETNKDLLLKELIFNTIKNASEELSSKHVKTLDNLLDRDDLELKQFFVEFVNKLEHCSSRLKNIDFVLQNAGENQPEFLSTGNIGINNFYSDSINNYFFICDLEFIFFC